MEGVQGEGPGEQPSAQPGVIAGQASEAGQTATASEILEGFQAQRSELRTQLRRLESDRRDVVQQIQRGTGGEANQRGLEQRLTTIDQRIATLDQMIAQADAQVAAASAVPGAVVPPPPPPWRPSGPSEGEIMMVGMVIAGVLLLPVMLAYTRRIWRRSAKIVSTLPDALMERFTRLEHAVDTVALEVERIGEGQRFMTRVFAEHGVPREAIPASLTDELNLPPETSSRGRR